MMVQESSRVYVMKNNSNGVVIECAEKFVVQWVARGFEVIEIRDESFSQAVGKISVDGQMS